MSFFRRGQSKPAYRAQGGYLTGQILIAMPGMKDQRFEQSVVFVVSHNRLGAMGLLVNKPVSNITFNDLLRQLAIQSRVTSHLPVQFGGPVETGRGFVLHSPDYHMPNATVQVIPNVISLTTTVDVLRAIADGHGPQRTMVALGYAGWSQGLLEAELQSSYWLHADADEFLLFHPDFSAKWEYAIRKLGFNPSQLAPAGGRA
jgi:putative transcriptional regulator